MIPYKSPLLTSMPPTPEKRLEVLQAMCALAAQEDEQVRQRRADIAALRRDFEALRRNCGLLAQTLRKTFRVQVLAEVHAELRKYSPGQLRVPAVNPNQGTWAQRPEIPVAKASPDDPKHPGWPAGTPGGKGGKYRPKDGEEGAADASDAPTSRRRIALSIEERCEAQYERDLDECRLAGSPACYEQAMLRYSNCLRGLPIPPLNY
jgi:hypothetical protein